MQDTTAPTRNDSLAPLPKTPQPRKRRLGLITFGLLVTLGLGVAGGANIHRLVDLDQAVTGLHHTGSFLQSGFEATRNAVAQRIESFTSRPGSVAQASQEVTSARVSTNDLSERTLADLSLKVDQLRAANDGSARDHSQGIERIHRSAEEKHQEIIAKLAQLAERVERVERHAASAAAAALTRPDVEPAASPSPPPAAKPVANPVQQPVPDAKVTVAPKQTPTEMKPSLDVRGIANWTVLGVLNGTAALEGPRGIVEVTVGDVIPGIGRVQAITRSGRRWVVATTKGVITPR